MRKRLRESHNRVHSILAIRKEGGGWENILWFGNHFPTSLRNTMVSSANNRLLSDMIHRQEEDDVESAQLVNCVPAFYPSNST